MKSVANKKTLEVQMQMESYRHQHEEWKALNKTKKQGFFAIFNDFKSSHLSEISGGALKAYVYFGMHANNKSGECWHSNETLSEFFNVDIRTVKKWVSELEERGLIVRVQVGFKRVANTFLRPYEAVPDVEDESEEESPS